MESILGSREEQGKESHGALITFSQPKPLQQHLLHSPFRTMLATTNPLQFPTHYHTLNPQMQQIQHLHTPIFLLTTSL